MNKSSSDFKTNSMFTDHYALTMLEIALKNKTAYRKSIFEVFSRELPTGNQYGVIAGTGRMLEGLKNFIFSKSDLDFLANKKIVNDQTLKWLEKFKFSGDIYGYPEGEIYFKYSPLLTIESTFAEACLMETYVLSILNHDTAIASTASKMIRAAKGRPCFELGSRRTHEEAAVAAARSAIIAGFQGSSNLKACMRYNIKTFGTVSHSFILLYDKEEDAFKAQLKSNKKNMTLLVDTYDIKKAIEKGVKIGGSKLKYIRLDSGNLIHSVRKIRKQLDSLGNVHTKIIVTSDLNEEVIESLAPEPVNAYGIGTALVTGSGYPTANLVYKLVSRKNKFGKFINVSKNSKNKHSYGGRKIATRFYNNKGFVSKDIIKIVNFDIKPLLFLRKKYHKVPNKTQRILLKNFVTKGLVQKQWIGKTGVINASLRHKKSLEEFLYLDKDNIIKIEIQES